MLKSKSSDYSSRFDELKKLLDERKEKAESAKALAESLKAEIAKCEADVARATDNVDYNTFETASIAKARAEFELKATERKIAEMSKPDSLSEYKEPWAAFSKAYEKEFSSLMGQYEEARHDLYNRFLELMEMQKQACEMRYRIGRACGYSEYYGQFLDITEYSAVGLFPGLQQQPARNTILRHSPDAAYFIASGDMPEEKDALAYQTIVLKH